MGLTEHRKAVDVATEFFGGVVPKSLGWGLSGSVFLSPQGDCAVKVNHRVEGYTTERDAYRLLNRLRITALHGLTVPRMWDCHDDLQLIRMDYVTAPYLLDFAGVLWEPPDFERERWLHWHEEIEAAYGSYSRWIPDAVYNSLQKYGMYYVDIRVSNLKLDGHPDYIPPRRLTWEDL